MVMFPKKEPDIYFIISRLTFLLDFCRNFNVNILKVLYIYCSRRQQNRVNAKKQIKKKNKIFVFNFLAKSSFIVFFVTLINSVWCQLS